MALLFCDGFGHATSSYDVIKWDSRYSVADIIHGAGIGSDGGWGAYINVNFLYYVGKYLTPVATVIAGVRFKTHLFTNNSLFRFHGADATMPHVQIAITESGTITAYRGSTLIATAAGGNVIVDTWAYIEAKVTISATVGAVEVRVDGVTVLNETGLNTLYSGDATIGEIRLSALGSSPTYVDDFYMCDTTGTENNDFLGDITVKTLYPTADGTYSDFTPSTGVDNYATVDEAQLADATDYNESGTVGDKDSYDVTTITGAGDILGVQVTAAVLNADTGTMNVRPFVRSGATPADVEGDDYALSQTMKGAMHIFEKEPTDDVAWDNDKVNAAEFGIKIQS